MRSNNNKKKNEFYVEANNFVSLIDTGIIYMFLFFLLAIFPLFYENGYQAIGDVKYNIFAKMSGCFLVAEIVLIVIRICLVICEYFKGGDIGYLLDEIKKRSFLDKAVAVYGICVLISFLLCENKKYALTGSVGWHMGLYAQLVFVALYFLLSWKEQWLDGILKIHLISSTIVFVLAILHRFQIDPLGMYKGLSMGQKIQYLSTLGQSSWYSSYMCTVFMVGVIIFYLSDKKSTRIWTGIYTVLCFATFITQNSDSPYISMLGILLLLGYFSLENKARWLRFIELIAVMFGSFVGIGILQRIFASRVTPLDFISIFLSQGIISWIALAVSIFAYFYFKKLEEEKLQKCLKTIKKIYPVLLILLVLGIVAMVVFIYLNTTGVLLQWFGFQSTNIYLYFNDYWGNHRGFNWSIAVEGFSKFPFVNKLFGVGPDSFAAYLYNIPEIAEKLVDYYNNYALTNAHNEYLNSLICYGVIGLLAWLTVLCGGIVYFYKKAKEEPFMLAFALCIMGYACHNIFCYQQICCTPFLFVALGIGESLTKSKKIKI